MLQMFVLALSLYNTWNRGVFLLCKITNLLIYRLLNVLLSSETTPKEKERILHDDFDIEMTQNLEREVSLMCNLSQDVVDRTLLSAIQHLMETLNLTAEQAMAALKIPETERPKYISWLEEQ